MHVQKHVVKKPVRKHVKPKKKAHRKKVVAKKPQPPHYYDHHSTAGFGGLDRLEQPAPPEVTCIGRLASIFIVIALSFAIASLSIALIPATRVPWRRVAVFVSDRQVDLTVAGFALLIATAFTLILTGGL